MEQVTNQMQNQASPGVPLCVDLDGTLVKSDTLHDSLMLLARQSPAGVLKTFGWLQGGKASFKRKVSGAVELDVKHLPYNEELLTYLREEKAAGRRIYLATAAEKALADRVAEELGIFDGVLASEGSVNLAGANKLAAFREMFPEGFCYIGNALPDAKLLAVCETPMVANPTGGLKSALKRQGTVPVRVFHDRRPAAKVFFKAIRIHQWAKNVLIFLPLLLAHQVNVGTIAGALMAFFSFSLCASATYIINDLLDIEADRRHPRKKKRPFASGDLSVGAGVGIIVLFFALSVAIALALPVVVGQLPGGVILIPYYFLFWLAAYTVTTLAYSIRLKRMVLVDVIVLSMLYTLRIVAGSASTGVAVSTWLGAFSIFFFLSLAFAKRFAEMEGLRARATEQSAAGRGYRVGDLEQLRTFGAASGYASVVVLTLYLNTLEAGHLYPHVKRLWLLIPVLILWISRLWMEASRGQLHDDPVVYAMEDRTSLLLGLVCLLVVGSAMLRF